MKKFKIYFISIIISLATGTFSSLLTRENMSIYKELKTPPFSPPSILFPIVWTILYVLMGVGAAIIYIEKSQQKSQKENALTIYGFSLFVNFTWSIIFFNLRQLFIAFLWLIFLWILILRTITEYFKINRAAAYLQIPYLLWVTFAGYLNAGIWYLNR